MDNGLQMKCNKCNKENSICLGIGMMMDSFLYCILAQNVSIGL